MDDRFFFFFGRGPGGVRRGGGGGLHVVVGFPGLRGSIDIETRTSAIVPAVVVASNLDSSRGGVREHNRDFFGSSGRESAGFLREVLIGTCEAREVVEGWDSAIRDDVEVRKEDTKGHVTLTAR